MDFVVGIVDYIVVDMSVGVVEEYIVGIVVVVVEDKIAERAVDIAAVVELLAVGIRLRFEKGLIGKKLEKKSFSQKKHFYRE